MTSDTVYNTNYIINFIDDSKNSFKNIGPLSSNNDDKKSQNSQKYIKKEYAIIPISNIINWNIASVNEEGVISWYPTVPTEVIKRYSEIK